MRLLHQLFPPMRAILEAVNTDGYKHAVANGLTPYLHNKDRILDVGCSDGKLSSELMRRNETLKILGVDVQLDLPARMPRALYNGNGLPFPDSTFDIVMAVDVLHHIKDMQGTLQEMSRVSRKYLLIKDHVWDGSRITWWLLSFFDWCTNAPYGIPCAYNFPTLQRWHDYFSLLELNLRGETQISNFPLKLNRRFNYVFSLEKARARA